jgi:O-antigen/teichoic acid export membrane protein
MQADHLRQTFRGTLFITAADALALPASLIAVIYLTRRLGPELFGVFILAYSVLIWTEFTITSFFARATIRAISDSADAVPVAGALMRWHSAAGIAGGAALWIAAAPIAVLMKEPAVAPALRLFAVEVPLFVIASGFRNIQIGLGRYGRRAAASAARILSRLVLLFVLVEGGLSIDGAILSGIGASAIEIVVAWRGIRAPLASRWPVARELWSVGVPTFLFSIAARSIDRIDLWMLKWLGATAAAAGIYGAAQNVARIPLLLATSMGPVVLAGVSRLLRDRRPGEAKELVTESLRIVFLLPAFAAAGAASARPLIELAFGPVYAPAAPVAAILLFAAVAMLALFIAASALTSYGRAQLTFAISWPLVILSAIGCRVAIPVWGAEGAAAAVTLVALVGSGAMLQAARSVTGAGLPLVVLFRNMLIGAAVFALLRWIDASGPSAIVLLAVACVAIIAALASSGDLGKRELDFFRRTSPADASRVTEER